MFVFANLLGAIAVIIHYVLNIYMWLIVARAVISWVSPDPYNPIVNFLYQATEPVLYRVRRYIPFWRMGALDITPIIVFIIIIFLDNFLVGTLQEIAFRMKE
jgi:YggT family protein